MTQDRRTGARESSFVGLLRGINVGGRNKVAMSELRALTAGIGCTDVQSYIQSGNLVFRAAARAADLEEELELALERRYGLSIPVIVRTARTWSGYLADNPFPEACDREPGLVMLAVSKRPPAKDAVAELQQRAAGGELIRQLGNVLWIHYAAGAGRSRVSPGLLDRAIGSPVTTRNWRTACELARMAAAPGR